MRTRSTWTVYLVVLSCLWAIGFQCCHAPFGWAEASATASASSCHEGAHAPDRGHAEQPEQHADDCHCHQWAAVPTLPGTQILSAEAGHEVPLLDTLLRPLVAFLPTSWQPLQPFPPPWPEPPPVRPTALQIVTTTYLLI